LKNDFILGCDWEGAQNVTECTILLHGHIKTKVFR
jgi:hypothetical protein